MKSHNLEQIFPLSSANKSFDQYFSSTQLEFFGYIKYNLSHYGPLEKNENILNIINIRKMQQQGEQQTNFSHMALSNSRLQLLTIFRLP